MTKSLREAQIKEKMDRYPKVVLRVQFPDRYVLQGYFRPLETGATVFPLFIAPPKTILDDPSATLFQVRLLILSFDCMLQTSTTSSSSVGFEEPLPPLEPTVEASRSTQDEEDPSTHTQAAKPARSDPGKVPKWLKLPGQDRKGSTHTHKEK
uniref:UBX domain-containing protein n=1 Tax=Amphilophus citrinellus TaxID=61819 RepID=A0A3Q0RFS0_AMPCI